MSKRRRSGTNRIRKLSFEHLEFRRLLVSGPWVLSTTPTEVRNALYDHVDVSFNSDIDAATFSLSDVTLNGPTGSVNVTTVIQLAPASFRLNFAPLTVRGDYRVVIGPDILDLAGNAMNQDKDGVNGEATADQFTTSLRLIVADVILTSSTTIAEINTLYDGKNILIDGATVAIDGNHQFGSVHIVNGGVLTHTENTTAQTHQLELNVVDQVIVDAASRIDVSEKGFLAGRTLGNTTVGGASGASGASFGGYGGNGTGGFETNSRNLPYGDYLDPDDWGSGGKGAGGGLVRIRAQSLQLNGRIEANGANAPYVGGGGASGGSIYVNVEQLTGSGNINANGGNGTGFGYPLFVAGGGGGGGRIAIYARTSESFDLSRVQALGGTGGQLYEVREDGGAGTVYVRDLDQPSGTLIIGANTGGRGLTPLGLPGQAEITFIDDVVIRGSRTNVRPEHAMPVTFAGLLELSDYGRLWVNSGTVTTGTTKVTTGASLEVLENLVLDGPLTLVSSGQVSVPGTLHSAMNLTVNGAVLVGGRIETPNLSVINTGVVTSSLPTDSRSYKLELVVAGIIDVDTSSRIDVSEKGFLAGRTLGNTTVGGASGASGASFGGYGGNGTGGFETNSRNLPYGDYLDPDDWGSGGKGAGGGLVRIRAQSLQLNGRIEANGANAPYVGGGGASGGSIYVNVEQLTGSGNITADGGSGSAFDYPRIVAGGGGGGGRIAIYARQSDSFDLSHVQSLGGTGGQVYEVRGEDGGAGTAYVRDLDQPSGTLIIGANTGGRGLTPLGLPGQAAITFIDDVVIRGSRTNVRPEHAMPVTFAGRLELSDYGRLWVNSGTVTTGTTKVTTGASLEVIENLVLEGPLTLVSSGQVSVPGTLHSAMNLTVNGAVLVGGRIETPNLSVVNAGLVTSSLPTDSRSYKLELVVSGTIDVDSTSRINVSEKGFLPGRTLGNTTVGGASGASGASFGGYGGNGTGGFETNSRNVPYGDYLDPDDWGSGGKGAGGGLVRIRAQSLQLNGRIEANGANAGGGGGGGASGGSIYVNVEQLTGSGNITADGGSGSAFDYPRIVAGGGGGGGRIAIYARQSDSFDLSHVQSLGGTGGQVYEVRGEDGGAGTAYTAKHVPHSHVQRHEPIGVPLNFIGVGNGHVSHAIDDILLVFNNSMDLASISASTFEVSGQMGRVRVREVTMLDAHTYHIAFSNALTENGVYHFRLAPTVKDVDGFALDQNANGVPGEPEDEYSFDLIVDTIAPHITSHVPAGDIAGTISSVDFSFSETIDRNSLTASNIAITRPDSTRVAVGSISEVGFNRFRIEFASQTLVGVYRVKIASGVRDLAGNKLDQDRDGNFGEATDDVYDAGFNLVQVDLGLSNLVVTPSSLWAGEPVSVSWNGANRSGAALLGNWIDAVYLSSDDKWDINDTRLTIVEHTGGLTAGSTYTGSATIYVPGKLPGNYRILVRADVANQERETNEANNVLASSQLSLDVRPLVTDGSAINGTLTTADRSDFYKIVLASGDSLKLKLHSSTSGSQTELYVSYAGLPSRVAFDQRSATPSADQGVSLKAIHGGGVYYVLVYGSQVPGSTPYTIAAEKATFFVSQVSPNRHGMAATAQLTVNGTGFDETTVVDFVNSSGASGRVPSQFVSETELIVTINFTEAPHAFTWAAGNYGVKVTQGTDSKTLPNAFEAVAGGTAKLETNLIVPSSVSPAFPVKQTLWVEYRNTGSIAMPAPLLQVSADGNSLLTTDENLANTVQTLRTIPNGLGGSVQLLGVGASATPGLLQPGEGGRLPVYYVGLSKDERQSQVNFSLGSLSARDTTEKVAYLTGPTERVVFERPATGNRQINPLLGIEPLRVVRSNATRTGLISDTITGGGGGGVGSVILSPVNVFEEYLMIDWNALRAARPSSIPADAWDAILYNVRDNFLDGTRGSDLWADYVTRMSANANYLATVGQTTSSVSNLWGFEVAGAGAALNPIRYLAGAVDASVAAPGLPLTFSRVYGQDIASRFRTSALGRGWTHNWDIRWSASDNGDITLHGPGGVDRFFTKNKNGSYLAAPGDYGQLTLAASIFTLLEADQTRWQFRTDGGLDFVADTNGNRITLGYSDGLLTSLTHSNGRQLLLAYSGNVGAPKLLVQVTDTMGPGSADDRITTYQYDLARQHLLGVVAPGNRLTQYEYASVTQLPFDVLNSKARLVNLGSYADPRSHALLSITHVDGTHDYFAYDNHGRLIETKKDANTERVTFIYTTAGGVKVIDATGRETLLNFGLGGQLAQVRDADGRIVKFAYDSKFQFSQLGGPGGEQYRYAYDAKGNLTNIRDALNLQTSFSYEPSFNRLAGFTDARGNGIDYRFDNKGNLTRITYEDLTHEDFTYDSLGNVITSTNRRGQVVAYVYNAASQVTSKDYVTTPGVDFTYQYDIAGNLTQATDAGGTTNLSYELLTDRLTRIEYPGGKFFTFAYDTAGRRTRRTDQDTNIENYAYDSIGRLDRMTDGAGALIVDYDYDSAGRLSLKTLGNGVYTTYLYDKAGNVKNLVNFKPDNTVLSRYDYEYDVAGRRTAMNTLSGRFDYGYDALGQLVSVRHPDGHVVAYDYDEAGNRRQVLDDGTATAYTTNNMNQYTQVGDVIYTFDADGNLISQTDNGVTTTYAYDIENRLTSVMNPTDTWAYTYDALGNRVAATHNGQATRYVIDPTGLGNVAAEYDGSGSLIARYDHGYGLLSRTDAAGAAFYTFQAIGNTSELTGVNGAVLNSYQYDPFGLSPEKTEAVANPFEYVGEYGVMNEGNGLEFMRARYYDRSTGRFTTEDPLGINGGTNLYQHVMNRPVTHIDPEGKAGSRPESRLGDPQSWGKWGPIGFIGTELYGHYEVGRYGDPYAQKLEIASLLLMPFGGGKLPKMAKGVAKMMLVESWPFLVKAAIDAIPTEVDPVPIRPILPLGTPVPQPHPVPIARSGDPNDKLAPAGVGDAAFVLPDSSLAYTVRFENQFDATAPAREIIVTDVLDADLDFDSFEITEIAFADQRIAVPAGLSHYETTVAMSANGTPIQVEVTADLDRDTRQFMLLLRAVDPLTGWAPEDPIVGFLYPNDATGRGQGSISYRVKSNAGLTTGTEITNRAKIYFDTNDPIDTPLVRNTLDAGGPTSQVAALPSTTTSPTFTVNWSGQDDANGSGIASYDLYGSRDGGIFVPYMSGTTLTSMSFTVIPGHTYSFYTVATDNVGHRENLPTAAQASIYVMPLTWHHPVDPLDVNDDGAISPLDALLVINRLNVQPRSTAPLPVPTLALHPAPYLDVTGDNFVTPLDALLVINYLNQRSAGGEGEFERTLLNAGPESEMSGAKPFPIWTTLRLDDPASRIVPSRRDEAILDMLAITVISDQPLKLPSSASLRRPVGEFSSADSKVLTRQDISTHDLDEGLLQFLASDLLRHKKSWRR